MEAVEHRTSRERAGLARHILTQGILLGILADALLRRTGDGYGWTLWVVALAFTAALLWRGSGARLRFEQVAWLGCAVLFSAAFAWRDSELLNVTSIFATLVALALFAMVSATAPAASVFAARIRDVLVGWAYAARDALIGVFPLAFREAELPAVLSRTATTRMPVLRAVILTLPLLLVFGSLLGSADPVFGSMFAFPEADLESIISHGVLTGFFAWISAGWMRGSILHADSGAHGSLLDGRPMPPATLPFTLRSIDVTMTLGALVVLFALFVGLQARWLFGGADVVFATTGLSLAEYARGGFFELVWVAVLVLPVILVSGAAIGDDPAAVRLHQKLSLGLLLLLGAIMASAVHRMQLYVGYFGLSVDRLFALVFMGWLALVFVAMALTVLRGWSRPFAAVTLVSGFMVLGALNVANPEAIVARTNLGRRVGSTPIDYEYLARLSGDAAPIVVGALVSAEPSASTCKAAERMLTRWDTADHHRSNLGAYRGRAAVLRSLDAGEVERLCAEGAP